MKSTMRKKLLLITIVPLIVLGWIIFFAMNIIFFSTIEKENRRNIDIELLHIYSKLEQMIEGEKNRLSIIANSEELNLLLKYNIKQTGRQYEAFAASESDNMYYRKYRKTKNAVDYIFALNNWKRQLYTNDEEINQTLEIFGEDGTRKGISKGIKELPETSENNEIIKKILNKDSSFQGLKYSYEYDISNTQMYFKVYFAVPEKDKYPKGVLVLTYPITRETLEKLVQNNKDEIIIIDTDYNLIEANFYNNEAYSFKDYEKQVESNKLIKTKLHNKKVFVKFFPILGNNDKIKAYLGVVKDRETIERLEYSINLLLSALIIFLIVLISLASWVMTRNILKPIERMVQGIKRVENGEYVPLEDVELSQEFEILRINFNTMIKKISDSFMEIKERDEKLTKVNKELKNIIIEKEQVYKLSITDGLTKLYNHRFFQEEISAEIFESKKRKRPLSLIFLDIDFFKQFNDTYGHQVGDETLERVANYLRATARKNDTVARYGGEEFAVILPATSIKEAYIVAERMRNYVEVDSKRNIPITVSMGVASYPENFERSKAENINDIKNELIHKSDIALYYSKEKGRNRTTIYTEGLSEIDCNIKN